MREMDMKSFFRESVSCRSERITSPEYDFEDLKCYGGCESGACCTIGSARSSHHRRSPAPCVAINSCWQLTASIHANHRMKFPSFVKSCLESSSNFFTSLQSLLPVHSTSRSQDHFTITPASGPACNMAASKRAVDILQHVFTRSPITMAQKELTPDQLRDDPSLWLDPGKLRNLVQMFRTIRSITKSA
jgi:hypothetical protein